MKIAGRGNHLDIPDLSILQQALTGGHVWVALAALFQASVMEYLLPILPGDTITVIGAVLVVTSGLPAWGVFAATMAGGLVGSAVDFWIGRVCRRAERDAEDGRFIRHPLFARLLKKADRISTRFATRGTVLLLLNRFMPGVRSLLFIAAGMAGMPFWKAMLAGAVSNALWTGLLILMGMILGANLDLVISVFRTYSIAAWVVLATIVLVWVLLSAFRAARARNRD